MSKYKMIIETYHDNKFIKEERSHFLTNVKKGKIYLEETKHRKIYYVEKTNELLGDFNIYYQEDIVSMKLTNKNKSLTIDFGNDKLIFKIVEDN